MEIKLFISIIFLLIGCQATLGGYTYTTKTFEVPLDHFSFVNNKTFHIRYLENNTFAGESSGPIFFYTGNEGDIELFAENTGLMWELAPKMKASLIFAEHRYYGKSLPFGNESFSGPEKLGYLSAEQALADYADLLAAINPEGRPVIAFGGSYGGMLAAWFRMKYPHLVTGALAASAPVRQFEVECDIFNRILTSVYKTSYNENCSKNIAKVWDTMKQQMANDKSKQDFNAKFKFCKFLNTTQELDEFFDYLNDVLGNLAMVNYPYESSFLAPLPAYPVRQFCYELKEDLTLNGTLLLDAFHRALNVYSNFTGKTKCLDIASAYDSSMGDAGWNFQSCTEMTWSNCQNGTTDMFPPKAWNFQEYSDECFKKFQVRPKNYSRMAPGEIRYGGGNLAGASNIIFSNGLLDPWSGGGIFNDQPGILVVVIPEGAHHLDLRASHKDDPESVTEARRLYVKQFKKWIDRNRKFKNVKRK
ncbi:lysosomal Pro-X carboxypeptidase [Culicoides brevitarsis]|uniref:lysosomal Pro-X carboxypeptidase n=1 Tax=Culicoides brevitarsis TaxID=469753 RepID=UPI00307BD4BC